MDCDYPMQVSRSTAYGRFEPTSSSDSSPQSCPPRSRLSRSFWARGNCLLVVGSNSRPALAGRAMPTGPIDLLRAVSLYPSAAGSTVATLRRQCGSKQASGQRLQRGGCPGGAAELAEDVLQVRSYRTGADAERACCLLVALPEADTTQHFDLA